MSDLMSQYKYMLMYRQKAIPGKILESLWRPSKRDLFFSLSGALDRAHNLQLQSDMTDSGLEYKVVELRDVKGNSE